MFFVVCGVYYFFIYVDIGSYVFNNDSSILNNCGLGKVMELGCLYFFYNEFVDEFVSSFVLYFLLVKRFLD